MITLSPYIVKLYNLRSQEYENVHNGRFSMTDIINSFHSEIQDNANVDTFNKKAIKAGVKTLETDNIRGIFKVGEYGYESDIHHTVEGSNTTRTPLEAELLPFYFYLKTRAESENSLLFLQRFKTFGIRTIFETYLQEYINDTFGRDLYALHISPVVFPEIIENYFRNNEVKRIKFVKSAYSDIADTYSRDPLHSFDAEFSIAVKRQKTFSQALRSSVSELFSTDNPTEFSGRINHLATIVGAPEASYETVKVELSSNGKTKTIDLVNARKVRHQYDVTSDVTLSTNGHPTLDSLENVTSSIANELSSMVWGANL